MSSISYYTKEGLKKLRDELRQLKDIERPKASNALTILCNYFFYVMERTSL